LIDYDSDFYTLPHVPFIIELPTLCYKVLVPMCKAQQQELLPHFDLIQSSIRRKGAKDRQIKNIGHKCLDFRIFSSEFELIGKNGWAIVFQPFEFCIDPSWSLDVAPATKYEAFAIYSACEINNRNKKVLGVTNDLNNDKITPAYVKTHFPGMSKEYERSKYMDVGIDFSAFEKAINRHALKEISINGGRKNRETIKELNLVASYFHILREQSGKKNKVAAGREAIKLFYPEITDDELVEMCKSFLRRIKRSVENKESINFLFPEDS